jgi:predicted DsbA family dithiol-disulfide isomerase
MVPVLDPIPITVYSDVICPWCYVGKRRLEAALAEVSPSVTGHMSFSWRPFELNPDMPAEGMERRSYRAAKFGDARSTELDLKMAETGRELGIAFAFDRMQRTPNTRLAHRLIWEAGRQGRQDAMVERLFHGYFEEGLDIGATDTLRSLADKCELDAKGVEQALTGDDSLKAVTKLEQEGYSLGIKGVPFFLLLHKYGVSGAQPPEFWRDALPKIAAEATAAAS